MKKMIISFEMRSGYNEILILTILKRKIYVLMLETGSLMEYYLDSDKFIEGIASL